MNREVKIQIDNVSLEGTLVVPRDAVGLVLFVHGSGSSHLSPRNVFVAEELQKNKIATLLVDLLTKKEDKTYENRFNIELLTTRLKKIIEWLGIEADTKSLTIGLFGASTGAAAALMAAAEEGSHIRAIVSRGGRPDLAMKYLNKVFSPTLLIVGGNDKEVIALNEQAYELIPTYKKMEIILGATHLFEEKGALEKVAEFAIEWFLKYF